MAKISEPRRIVAMLLNAGDEVRVFPKTPQFGCEPRKVEGSCH
jgi:hypothetical protein